MGTKGIIPSWAAWGIFLGVALVAIAAIVLGNGDLLNTRILKSGQARVRVGQGEEVMVALSDTDSFRKLELCTANQHIFGWYTDYVNCETLEPNVKPHTRQVVVAIPRVFPLERAAIIVRTRNSDGSLIENQPVKEKIEIWVTRGKFSATPTPTPVGYQESFR